MELCHLFNMINANNSDVHRSLKTIEVLQETSWVHVGILRCVDCNSVFLEIRCLERPSVYIQAESIEHARQIYSDVYLSGSYSHYSVMSLSPVIIIDRSSEVIFITGESEEDN